MNISEILKAKGVADDVIASVLEDMKANKIFTASEENLDVRYGKLKTDHESKIQELTEANNLIAELQKTNKGNEDLQGKITDYESRIQKLQNELEETKIDSEINIGLLSAGVNPDDIDYLAYKLKAKGELALDDDGKIKGWEDKLSGLKTQCPRQFESSGNDGDGYKLYNPNMLNEGDDKNHTPSREEFLGMSYEQRVALKQKNEELYKKLAK